MLPTAACGPPSDKRVIRDAGVHTESRWAGGYRSRTRPSPDADIPHPRYSSQIRRMPRWEFVFPLEREGGTPLFQQIARGIAGDIRRGRLRPGDALPGTRTLARALGVQRLTVAAAFDELIAEGWLVTRAARGTFVSNDLPDPRPRRFAPRRATSNTAAYDLLAAPEPELPYDVPKGTLLFAPSRPDVRLVRADRSRVSTRRRETRRRIAHLRRAGGTSPAARSARDDARLHARPRGGGGERVRHARQSAGDLSRRTRAHSTRRRGRRRATGVPPCLGSDPVGGRRNRRYTRRRRRPPDRRARARARRPPRARAVRHAASSVSGHRHALSG